MTYNFKILLQKICCLETFKHNKRIRSLQVSRWNDGGVLDLLKSSFEIASVSPPSCTSPTNYGILLKSCSD